jgi:hypothetical protein
MTPNDYFEADFCGCGYPFAFITENSYETATFARRIKHGHMSTWIIERARGFKLSPRKWLRAELLFLSIASEEDGV